MATHILRVACLATLLLLGSAQSILAASVTLAWDHSSDSGVAGYLVSYGTKSGAYTANVRAGYVTAVTITGLTDGSTYYFILQSYNNDNVTGPPTAEVSGQVGAVPLVIGCPSPTMTSLDGQPVTVTLTPTVTGGVNPVTTSCSPASGSLFPVGTTSFTCTAVDATKQKASCTSSVVVLGSTTPPPTPVPPAPLTLSCPSIAPVTENGNSGKGTVRFDNPTYSGGSGSVTVSCDPRSGSQLPIGTTTVSCTATDSAGQTASCSTTATVNGASGGGGRR